MQPPPGTTGRFGSATRQSPAHDSERMSSKRMEAVSGAGTPPAACKELSGGGVPAGGPLAALPEALGSVRTRQAGKRERPSESEGPGPRTRRRAGRAHGKDKVSHSTRSRMMRPRCRCAPSRELHPSGSISVSQASASSRDGGRKRRRKARTGAESACRCKQRRVAPLPAQNKTPSCPAHVALPWPS